MLSTKILIIEDNEDIAEILNINLQHAGISSLIARDTQDARYIIQNNQIDIIILDWMLPKQSGISFLKEIKNNPLTKDIPIIMLTARANENDLILGLESGADDYITKPFSPKEVIARVKSAIRRLGKNDILSLNYLVINPINKQAYIQYDNNLERYPITLGPTEFKLLYFFMTHPNRVYSRQELLAHVWNDIGDIDERTVDVQIKRLRKSISLADIKNKTSNNIETIRGFGYKFNN